MATNNNNNSGGGNSIITSGSVASGGWIYTTTASVDPSDGGWITVGGTDTITIGAPEPEKHPLAKKVKKPDGSEGMDCVSCEKYVPYAEPNQEDETMKCYECRNPTM